VQVLGHNFLAGTRFTGYQYGLHPCFRYFSGLLDQCFHNLRFAYRLQAGASRFAEIVNFLLHSGSLQDMLDGDFDFVHVERFREVICRSQFHGPDRRFRCFVSGQHHHLGDDFFVSDVLQDVQAAAILVQMDIQHDKVGMPGRDVFDNLVDGRLDPRFVPLLFECARQHGNDQLIVVY